MEVSINSFLKGWISSVGPEFESLEKLSRKLKIQSVYKKGMVFLY